MTSIKKNMSAAGLIGFGVIMIIFFPLAIIWSWNQLFGDIKMIEYSFWNWLAVIIIGKIGRGVKIERVK